MYIDIIQISLANVAAACCSPLIVHVHNTLYVTLSCAAWANGEPLRILYPTDSMGRLCGAHSEVRWVAVHLINCEKCMDGRPCVWINRPRKNYVSKNGITSNTVYPISSPFRDKPYLLFFDITKCATVVSVGELIQGQVDTSSIFTCPTQQVQTTVNYITCLVYTLVCRHPNVIKLWSDGGTL